MALIKMRRQVVSYIGVILLIFVCYVFLDGRSGENINSDLEKHFKLRDDAEPMQELRIEEEVNVFIILCIRLDGNGNFVSR